MVLCFCKDDGDESGFIRVPFKDYRFTNLFCFLAACFGAVFSQHHVAFVQTGDELHYFTEKLSHDSIVIKSHTRSFGGDQKDGPARTTSLTFEPASLKFGDVAIGIPAMQKVTVHNPTDVKVRFDAISGSTIHFHCSFFEHKTIEPGDTTTFDVVFLARTEGLTENLLFIHTSLGTLKYAVSGIGIPNPYRLRPFVGAKIPLNGTFVSNLVMHNPHSSTLKVLEMFTSGGNLHLELPTGRLEEMGSVWEIPPFQTKTIMRARFVACRARNATAYIKIKTNQTARNHIVLPMDVEVSSDLGIYSSVDLIDFGVLKAQEISKYISLAIFNAANESVKVVSVQTDVKNDAISIRLMPSAIQPNRRTPVNIASLRFDAKKLKSPSQQSGVLLVKTENDRFQLSIPYKVEIIEEQLLYDQSAMSFYAGDASDAQSFTEIRRSLSIGHTFLSPLAVYNVSLFAKSVSGNFTLSARPDPLPFKITMLMEPVIIEPKDTFLLTNVTFLGFGYKAQQEVYLNVFTNVTTFSIPLYIYTGKLRVTLYSLEEGYFDFGTMDSSDNRSIMFAITNVNPIAIVLTNLTHEDDSFSGIELLGVEEGNDTILAKEHNTSLYDWKKGQNFTIPANSFAVFRYSVTAPDGKGVYNSAFLFQSQFENRRIPVTFNVEDGAIISVPDKIVFTDSFPGKLSTQPLQIYSTFKTAMPVLRLSTLSHDPRIFFESFNKDEPPIIKPHQMTFLGRVFLFPVAGCLDDCYVGLPLESEDGLRWVYGMELPPDLPEIDIWLFRKLRSKFDQLEASGEHLVNSTIVVDTTTVKGFEVAAQGQLSWPRLMKQSSVTFPLTALHNTTIVNLTLHNPTSLPVIVQIIPLPLYPNADTMLQLFSGQFKLSAPISDIDLDDIETFTLRDSELFNIRPDSPVPLLRRALETSLKTKIPRYTLSLTLQPGMKVRIRAGFHPRDYDAHSSLLLVRNNLTVLEAVSLYGRGGRTELRIGSRLPFSVHPLLFEIQEKHLKECENIKRLQHKLPTSLTVRRSFVARNTGELPIYIGNISVNSIPCQNRGFRVLNCEAFVLKPNDSHVLEIAFTPDFTMSWFEAQLQLYFTGISTPLVYTVAASVPREWLHKCQNALPRPYWEPLAYYACITALGFSLICVVASAYLEGDRIITCAQHRQRIPPTSAPFDLNNLARSDHSLLVAASASDVIVSGNVAPTSKQTVLAAAKNKNDQAVAARHATNNVRPPATVEVGNSANAEKANQPTLASRVIGSLLRLCVWLFKRLVYSTQTSSQEAVVSVAKQAVSVTTIATTDLHGKAPSQSASKAEQKRQKQAVKWNRSLGAERSTPLEDHSPQSDAAFPTPPESAASTPPNGVTLSPKPSTPATISNLPPSYKYARKGSGTGGRLAGGFSSDRITPLPESVSAELPPLPPSKPPKSAEVVEIVSDKDSSASATNNGRNSASALKLKKHKQRKNVGRSNSSSNSIANSSVGKLDQSATGVGVASKDELLGSEDQIDSKPSSPVDKTFASAGSIERGKARNSSTDTGRNEDQNGKQLISESEIESSAPAKAAQEQQALPTSPHARLHTTSSTSSSVCIHETPRSKLSTSPPHLTNHSTAAPRDPLRKEEAIKHMLNSQSSPFSVAAKLTASVVNKNKRSDHASDSEESTAPEWDTSPLPKESYDDAFEQFSLQTASFTSFFGQNSSPASGSRSSSHTGGGAPLKSNVGPRLRQGAQHQMMQAPKASNLEQPLSKALLRGLPSYASTTARSTSTSSLEETDSSSSSPLGVVDAMANANLLKKKRRPLASGGGTHANVLTASPRNRGSYATKSPSIGRSQKTTAGRSVAGTTVSQRSKGYQSSSPQPTAGGGGSGYASGQDWDPMSSKAPGGPSIMQQLQAERKRRKEVYDAAAQSHQGEDWPGFNVKPVTDALWDEEYNPWKSNAEKAWNTTGTASATPPPGYSLFPESTWSTTLAKASTGQGDFVAPSLFTPPVNPPPADPSIAAWAAPKPGFASTSANSISPMNLTAATSSSTLPRQVSDIWKSFDLESNPDYDVSWTKSLLQDEQ